MRKLLIAILSVTFIFAISDFSSAQDASVAKTVGIYRKSDVVKQFFDIAYGYAVFPNVGQAGFMLGGAYGAGKVFADNEATGTTRMYKVSIGLQAGAQAFSQMIFFQDKRAYDNFTSGSFAFGAGASAVAITAGTAASAGTQGATASASAGPATAAQAHTRFNKGMAVFVHTIGGLMLEVSLGGQRFSFQPFNAPLQ